MNCFTQVLNMSISAGYVILIVIIARLLLRRFPAKYSYVLWSVVLFRLAVPFTIVSAVSMVGIKPAPVPVDIALSGSPKIDIGITYIDDAVNSVLPAARPEDSVNPLQVGMSAANIIWFAGIALLLLYSLVSYIALKRRLTGYVPLRDNIFLADHISTPFVMGVLKPKIYLPSAVSEKELPYIVMHERVHIKRLDHIAKIIAFAALSAHWFNPLVWLAFALYSRDMERSCDEAVLRRMGDGIKSDYSASLLASASGSGMRGRYTPAFGEFGVKERIKNVMNYKTPSKAAGVAAVLIVLAVCVGCVSNGLPADTENTLDLLLPAAGEDTGEPVRMTLTLPEGWEVREPDEDFRAAYADLAFNIAACIYDGDGYAAFIGYNTFTPYEEEIPREDYYKTVYPSLRLGSMYIWEPYNPVKSSEDAETAVVTVNYKDEAELEKNPGAAAAVPFTEVPGILSYDKNLGVYIGIQFAQGVATDEQVREIAESISLNKNTQK